MHIFTFIDRTVTLRYYPEDPLELTFYLGDALEERLQAAVSHYDQPHTLQEDRENLLTFLGREQGEQLLSRAEPLDRLSILELLSYTVRALRQAQGDKLQALAQP